MASSPVYQQARQLARVEGTDAKSIEVASDKAAKALWAVPEKAVQQGIVLAQESQVFFSRVDAIASTLPLHNTLSSQSVGRAFDKLVTQKTIIPVTSGKGLTEDQFVSASIWEMEKQIITTILQGKNTQTPLMERLNALSNM